MSIVFKDTDRTDLTHFVSIIKPMLTQVINDTVAAYLMILIRKPIDYIVPAVWGIKHNEAIDGIQSEIYKKINPTVLSVREMLVGADRNLSRELAIECIIRERIIFNIIFLVEKGRRQIVAEDSFKKQGLDLNDIIL